MRRVRALSSLAALTAIAVVAVGCSDVEDAARDAVGDAACSVAREAVDQAGQQASEAASQIGADPEAAQRELSALRDALATAERGVDGETKQKVTEAKDAVEDLLGQARDAAEGVDVDTGAVDRAQADLEQAVEDVKNVC